MGLTFVCVDGSCNYESYFIVDVNIEPKQFDFSCATQKDERDLEKMIKKVTQKKFDKYFKKTQDMAAMQMEEFCGGETGATSGDRRTLQEGSGARDLIRRTMFNYIASSKCRFCLPGRSNNFANNSRHGVRFGVVLKLRFVIVVPQFSHGLLLLSYRQQ